MKTRRFFKCKGSSRGLSFAPSWLLLPGASLSAFLKDGAHFLDVGTGVGLLAIKAVKAWPDLNSYVRASKLLLGYS